MQLQSLEQTQYKLFTLVTGWLAKFLLATLILEWTSRVCPFKGILLLVFVNQMRFWFHDYHSYALERLDVLEQASRSLLCEKTGVTCHTVLHHYHNLPCVMLITIINTKREVSHSLHKPRWRMWRAALTLPTSTSIYPAHAFPMCCHLGNIPVVNSSELFL